MKKFIKRTDMIVIAVILIIAFAIFLINRIYFSHNGDEVIVTIDNAEVGRYPLDEPMTMTIKGYQNGTNTLVIKDGKADIIEASCPDQICVDQHSVSKTGESIICLPNKVVINIISSSDNEAEVDIIAK